MLKEIRQIFQEDASKSYYLQKRIEKCNSATEISKLKIKRNDKLSEDNESTQAPLNQVSGPSKQHYRQNNQFLFCLKLKMIGITRLLQNNQIDSQKIASQDPMQILAELAKKIKVYQKQVSKRENEQYLKYRSLQIQVITLQSTIQTLQSDLAHSRKQGQRNSKVNSMQIKKLETKNKQLQILKEGIQVKMQTNLQVAQEQANIITELQSKIHAITTEKQRIQALLFEKQKDIIRINNQQKLSRLKIMQQCEGFKDSLMKKTEQINKLTHQIRNMKQNLENKELKIEQQRKKYNILSAQIQKQRKQLISVQQAHSRLSKQLEKSNINLNKSNEKVKMLQEFRKFSIQKLEAIQKKWGQTLQTIQQLTSQLNKMRQYQHGLNIDIDGVIGHMDKLFSQLQHRHFRSQEVLKQQFQIQLKIRLNEVEGYWKNKLNLLEDQIVSDHFKNNAN